MKKKIIEIIKKTLKELNYPIINPEIQKPKNDVGTDFATNIAFKLSGTIKENPHEIALKIKEKMDRLDFFSKTEVAKPGFINFSFKSEFILNGLKNIIKKGEKFGRNDIGKNKKVLIEFVSANPTGPLTVGHGRGAIIGDVMSNIYSWNGYNVTREYYYNNAGRQMRKLGESTYARYLELHNVEYNFPEDGYKGDYIKEIAKNITKKFQDDLLGDSNLDFFKNVQQYQWQGMDNHLIEEGQA